MFKMQANQSQQHGSRKPWQSMKKWVLPTLAVLMLAGSAALMGGAPLDDNQGQDEGNSYAIGLWGDLPYNDAQALVGVPNLIADMNSQNLAFTVHDGDLKAGNAVPGSVTPTTCSDALYQYALDHYFSQLRAPAAFTPGDNDWTDCDAASNGPFNSLERLDHERQVFFSTPFTLGQHNLRQEVQETPQCLSFSGNLAPCVENRRWTLGGVTYATVNIQGSCNNLCKVAPDPIEWAYRRDADIAWIQDTFQKAKDRNSAAIMFISQGDPGFNDHPVESEPMRNPQTLALAPGVTDGFQEILLALRDQVIAFRKPVVYVHGDTHYFRIDKPFLNAQGQRLENFTRIETFGDHQENGTNDVNWVKVRVDAASREVFAFQPQIVPGNRTAVPAP
jgi:hypothetical protein